MAFPLWLFGDAVFFIVMALVGLFLGGRAGAFWGVVMTEIIGMVGFVVPLYLGIYSFETNPTTTNVSNFITSVFSLDNLEGMMGLLMGEAVGGVVAVLVGHSQGRNERSGDFNWQ